MLVDDNPDMALSFKIGLRDDGFDVYALDNPILALSAFKPDYYNLLVLDIKMEKINGFELYERIKKIDDKVKVCFVTAMEEYKHRVLRKIYAIFFQFRY